MGSIDIKNCRCCGVDRSLAEFSRNCRRSDGLDVHCRVCTRERMRLKRRRHLARGACAECGEPIAGSGSIRYCPRCVQRYAGRSTAFSRTLRAQVLRAYSNGSPHCACCGEANWLFLTLDHIDNGGRAHRSRRGTQGVLRELKRDGFPIGFRVLCFNCNLARGFYGTCPHAAPGMTNEPGRRSALKSEEVLGLRRCTRCRRSLPADCFYPDKGGPRGLQSRCRACTREAATERLRLARQEALAHYSAGEVCCQCCGEREQMFLALDHIGGQGPRRPGRRSGGNTFYAWLRKQGYPAGLRVLCHNCNCAMGKDRECPHTVGGCREFNSLPRHSAPTSP
jgi:hypothetical protein